MTPASRTASSISARSALGTGNRQALHAQGRGIHAVAEFEIVCRRKIAKHLFEISCDGHAGDGIGNLPVLDPEPCGTAAVIAGDGIDAHADELSHVEAFANIGNQLVWRFRSGLP